MANIPQDRAMTYNVEGAEVRLTPSIVKNYLVNGNGAVTDREIVQFMTLCRYQGINPFLREAYLIKYGSSDATIVTGKDFFIKRARQSPDMEGFRAGVIVGANGDTEETEGYIPEGKTLVGGWAEVYVKGWRYPVKVQVAFQEYVGKKRDGSVTSMWKNKPATMIRKVALVQALREAFPGLYGGLYSPEETDTDSGDLSGVPIDVEPIEKHPDDAHALGKPQIMPNAAEREPDVGNKPAFRSRRNSQTVNGNEIKTCGITGQALEYIKKARGGANGEIVRSIINRVCDSLEVQDITFLREDEGAKLWVEIETVLRQKAPESDPPTPDGQPEMPPIPEEPPHAASGPQEPPSSNGTIYLHCPERNQRISSKICEARCEKREKCQAYQEAMFDGGA